MKLEGKTTPEIMAKLGIHHKTQVDTWWRRYINGKEHRFLQPVGKQYSYGKGPDELSKLDRLKIGNNMLKNKITLMGKCTVSERM